MIVTVTRRDTVALMVCRVSGKIRGHEVIDEIPQPDAGEVVCVYMCGYNGWTREIKEENDETHRQQAERDGANKLEDRNPAGSHDDGPL